LGLSPKTVMRLDNIEGIATNRSVSNQATKRNSRIDPYQILPDQIIGIGRQR